jgi:hypothetical protein
LRVRPDATTFRDVPSLEDLVDHPDWRNLRRAIQLARASGISERTIREVAGNADEDLSIREWWLLLSTREQLRIEEVEARDTVRALPVARAVG